MKTIVPAVIAIAISLPAAAQYRDNQPPVMERPAPPAAFDERPLVDGFRDAYKRAGSPRIVIAWNQPFDDTLADARIKQKVEQSSGRRDLTSLEDISQGAAGQSKLTESKSSDGNQKTTREGEFVANKSARQGPAEKGAWILEAEVGAQLAKAGVRLIDRAAIMRTTSEAGRGTDSRAVETAAFVGKADLLLEILLSEDRQGPSGWLYRVGLLNVKSGERLMDFVTYAHPTIRPQPARYAATDKGFQRVDSRHAPTLGEVAHELSLEIMKQMTARIAMADGKLVK